MSLKDSVEKRETSKWLPLINHWKLGKCVILIKEKTNWKYWLLWWWIEKFEWKCIAMARELREEIWSRHTIEMMKNLTVIETRSQIHNIFALKLGGSLHPARKEIDGFAFYPLEDKYSKEREAIRQNMENYAIKAVNEFRHNYDRKNYEVSNPQIEWKYFDQFHRELDDLKRQILRKK